MLIVSRKKSESVLIGDDIEVLVTEIGADRVKIGIRAPKGEQPYRSCAKSCSKRATSTARRAPPPAPTRSTS